MIQLSGIYKSYNEKPVFENFSFSLAENKITCLLGKSGIGKTTLINIITGLTQPDRGTVTGVKGEKLSVMFQDDRLLPFCDALSNITFTGAQEQIAKKYLGAVMLGGKENLKPAELSGGMKRRLALARALACPDYSVILLDEPFTGQDEATRAELTKLLKSELSGKTALIITHFEEEAESLADVIVRI